MTRRAKLIEDMRNNPKDVQFERLHGLLIYYGFEYRIKGSHHVYSHPAVPELEFCVPRARPVIAIYVKRALQWIDMVKEEWSSEEE